MNFLSTIFGQEVVDCAKTKFIKELDFNPFTGTENMFLNVTRIFIVFTHLGICVNAKVQIEPGRHMVSGFEIVLPQLHPVNYFQHSITVDGLLLGNISL